MIIDGKDLILGRLASVAAKKALLGEKVDIINCDDIVISGDRKVVINKYLRLIHLGSQPNKGPFFPKRPDRFVRRAIRTMLPMTTPRGKEAFDRVMCYINIPEDMKTASTFEIKDAHVSKLSSLKYIKVKEVCKVLGARIY